MVEYADAASRFVVPRAEAERHDIHQVEGRPLSSPASVRVLAEGAEMLVLEVAMPGGESSPAHEHDHESVGYVVSGHVRAVIDGIAHDLHAGDGFRHPPAVEHSMTAVGSEAVWLEIKSPPVRTW